VIKKEDYQNWADVIRSDQVPIARVIQVMQENPKFADWYRKTYLNEA
tara:strand:- start:244 stop:384 length:141 start_codon:yes stop_codon:yes gene_type:complete